jgi:sensor histidine kinase YesM
MSRPFRFWAGIVAVNAVAAVLAQLLFEGTAGRTWPGFVADCSATFVFLILTGVGYFDRSSFSASFADSLKVSVIATLLFGSFRTATETLRTRLDATTLALRTKERDEADARRVATEAQLASLESRVQPHFLFNTLNSISALIPTDPAGAERMTGQLASLMRSSLNADQTALVRRRSEAIPCCCNEGRGTGGTVLA